jgi:hypothetical protein
MSFAAIDAGRVTAAVADDAPVRVVVETQVGAATGSPPPHALTA